MRRTTPAALPRLVYEPVLKAALREDFARAGDLTSEAVVDEGVEAEALVVFRQAGRVCGVESCMALFDLLEGGVARTVHFADGTDVEAGTVVATLRGSARAILAGERTMLNLAGRLSGIATATRSLVAAMGTTRAQLAETRKTTPGLRALEKYATRVGGAKNHRMGLDDAVMIKDNHVAIAGSLAEAVSRARDYVGHLVKIELEIDRLEQLDEALAAGPDVVLLDNMTPDQLREAVARNKGQVILEASGGVRPETIGSIAETGVDVISMGWLTHSAPCLDVALDLSPA